MRTRKNISSRRQDDEDESLEDLLGTNVTNPFGTTSLSKFEESLKSMRYEDMMELARTIGINVHQPSQRIVATLLKEFRERYGSSDDDVSTIEKKQNEAFTHLDDDDRDELRDLMYVPGSAE